MKLVESSTTQLRVSDFVEIWYALAFRVHFRSHSGLFIGTKSVTLNGVMSVVLRYFGFEADYITTVEIKPKESSFGQYKTYGLILRDY